MGKKLTTEEFIERSRKVHNNKYDYSLVEYKNVRTKVGIVCSIHGLFYQTPQSHLNKHGCSKCGDIRTSKGLTLSQDTFIKLSTQKHNNKYDYSLVVYQRGDIKIKIICPIHGVFEQRPHNHLTGQGCSICGFEHRANSIRLSIQEFIESSIIIHNNFYDYSLVEYINSLKKVKILCPIHGEFEQTPANHLFGQCCPKCSHIQKSIKLSFTTQEFIKKSQKIHNNKYDYSLVRYSGINSIVKIICPIHGEFEQKAGNHLHGKECYLCGIIQRNLKHTSNTKEFIEKAIKIHYNKYDYSLVVYMDSRAKVKILCPIHGEFEQTPASHLANKGCSLCSSSKGELKIAKHLKNNNVQFISEHIFKDCVSLKNYPLRFDFYLPNHNLCIEYDGALHYQPIDYFGGSDALEKTQLHDKIKNEYCKVNKIKLLRIPYTKFDRVEAIIEEELNWVDIIDELF